MSKIDLIIKKKKIELNKERKQLITLPKWALVELIMLSKANVTFYWKEELENNQKEKE